MNIVVGIGAPVPESPATFDILRRLGFPDLGIELVHAIAPPIPVGWPAEIIVATETLLWHRETDGARVLATMEDLATRNSDLGAMSIALLEGSAADAIVDHIERDKPQLLAIDATCKGKVERLLAGSTAQSLVIHSPCPVLVARPQRHPGPLKAVFATDHSPYAERCAHMLAGMAPTGIASVTVATAWEESRMAAVDALAGSDSVRPSQALREALVRRNEMTEKVLESVALHTHSVLLADDPNNAIQRVVEESGADLLILGARGHGFMDRLSLGSVSMHQALHSSASVLVLR